MTRLRAQLTIGGLALWLSAMLPCDAAGQTSTRDGAWFGIGAGAGRADVTCDACAATDASSKLGGSAYVKAGWTWNPHVLVGGELNVWTRKRDFDGADAWFTMYNASATLTLYPSATAGYFVKGGGGMAYVDTDVERRDRRVTLDLGSGPGFVLGAGYDARVGRVSITPAVNFWFGHIGNVKARGEVIASGWAQHVVDVTIGVTFP